jgi:hypothetical protein
MRGNITGTLGTTGRSSYVHDPSDCGTAWRTTGTTFAVCVAGS